MSTNTEHRPRTSASLSVESRVDARTGALVVSLTGEAGMLTLETLEAGLTKVTSSRPSLVVLDLADVTFISSLAIGALVTFHRGVVRGGGLLLLGGLRASVLGAFSHARLDRFFEIYRTSDEAIREAIATGRAQDAEARSS